MSEHSGLPVPGYLPQNQAAVDLVSQNKLLEEMVLRVLDQLANMPETDKRWLAIGRTNFETGWMCVNRAIFKPSRIPLPGDPEAPHAIP